MDSRAATRTGNERLVDRVIKAMLRANFAGIKCRAVCAIERFIGSYINLRFGWIIKVGVTVATKVF